MYQISYHFLEIRLRFFYLLLSLILTMITSYYYQYEILYIIGRPFLDLHHKFILIDLTEALYTILRICGVLSFFIVMPFFVYHIWCFYIPSRYQFERNIIKKFSCIFFCMLFMEVMALYLVIFPKICEFLLSFEFMPGFKNQVDSFDSVPFDSDPILETKLEPIDTILELKQKWNHFVTKLELHSKKELPPLFDGVNSLKSSTSEFVTKIELLPKINENVDSKLKDSEINKLIQLVGSFQNLEQMDSVLFDSLQNLGQIGSEPNNPTQLNKIGTDLQSVRNISDNTIYSDIKKGPVLIELTARLESYVKLCTRFYSIMLTIFQIPFFVVILYYYNIIDCYILCKFRKFFLFSSVLISALISPPDIMSQCILACFLFFLYELLIFIGIFFEMKK